MRSTSIGVALLVLAAFCAVPALGLQVDARAQARSLEQAFKLIGDGKFKQAKTEIDKAMAAAGGPCGECFLGLSHIYASEKKWSEAADASRQAIPLLKSPALLARAYNQLGIANVMLDTPDSLAQAEEALRKAAAAGGAWGAMARYNLAELLYRRRSWAEAAETARLYLQEAGPDGTALKEARVLLCRARNLLPEEPSPEPEEVPKDVASDPLRVGGGVSRPEIIYRTDPQYTQEAREAKVRGTVILEAIIDEDGCIRNARPLKGQPHGLTESAMGAVRNWVFFPAMLEDRPVTVYYVLTINFDIQKPPPRLEYPSSPPG